VRRLLGRQQVAFVHGLAAEADVQRGGGVLSHAIHHVPDDLGLMQLVLDPACTGRGAMGERVGGLMVRQPQVLPGGGWDLGRAAGLHPQNSDQLLRAYASHMVLTVAPRSSRLGLARGTTLRSCK
jgi:hypothetical protein